MSAAAATARRWRVVIPNWHPSPVNAWSGRHWRKKHRLRKQNALIIGTYGLLAGVPRAAGKRRVELTIVLGPKQKGCDPDAYWKLLLDCLKQVGLLMDDRKECVELAWVGFERAREMATVIELEDV